MHQPCAFASERLGKLLLPLTYLVINLPGHRFAVGQQLCLQLLHLPLILFQLPPSTSPTLGSGVCLAHDSSSFCGTLTSQKWEAIRLPRFQFFLMGSHLSIIFPILLLISFPNCLPWGLQVSVSDAKTVVLRRLSNELPHELLQVKSL